MTAAPIRLLQLSDALDQEGAARVALLLPAKAGSASTRPVLQVYASVAAAVAAKQILECGGAERRPAGGACD